MIKIAVLESRYSGRVTSVNDLVVELDKDKFKVVFVYLSGYGSAENHMEQAGYTVCTLSNIRRLHGFRLGILHRLVRILRENDIDILHCHAHKATVYAAIAGMLLPKLKIIAHVHGLNRSGTVCRKLTNRLLLWRVDRFLPIAEAVRRDLLSANKSIPPSKATVLENSVDYDKFANVEISKSQVRQTLGIPDDALVFGFIGRFAPTKGIPYLIDAFALVKKEFSSAYLLLVGQGPDEQQYRQQVQKLGVQESVHFSGYRTDIEKVFRGLDVFVLSSVAEGMGRVNLEAMASCVPVVATAVGGVPEIVADSETGLLVASRDSEALAQAMTRMAQMPADARERIADAAKEMVRTRYSHHVVREKLRLIYEQVHQGRTGTGTAAGQTEG